MATSTEGIANSLYPVSTCVINRYSDLPIHTTVESSQNRAVFAIGLSNKKGEFESYIIRRSCALATKYVLEGMSVSRAFREVCKETRKTYRFANSNGSASLLLATIEGGVLVTEWVGELSIFRLRNDTSEVLCESQLLPMHQGGYPTLTPSFSKRRLKKGDRLVAMSSNLSFLLRNRPNTYDSLLRTSVHECSTELVNLALHNRIDHAALIVTDTWKGIL